MSFRELLAKLTRKDASSVSIRNKNVALSDEVSTAKRESVKRVAELAVIKPDQVCVEGFGHFFVG